MFALPLGLSLALETIHRMQAERSAAREEALRNLAIARAHEQAAIAEMLLVKRLVSQRP